MSCTSPYRAFRIGTTENGKAKLKLCSRFTDHVELRSGVWYPVSCSFASRAAERVVRDFDVVPCGKCASCRMDYSREWSNRCLLELKHHRESCFCTFTYDDEHVPLSYTGDENGEAVSVMTLRKRDFQLFMKRLRKSCAVPIRFLACGEYGGRTYRPHYHAILFSYRPDDLTYWSTSPSGEKLFHSDKLDKIWSHGNVLIGDVTSASCAYVARYVVKKSYRDVVDWCDVHNIEPEFLIASRRPGIGAYDYKPEGFDTDSLVVSDSNGAKRISIPKYYRRKLAIDNPAVYDIMKLKARDVAAARDSFLSTLTDLSPAEYDEVRDSNLRSRLRQLPRKEV